MSLKQWIAESGMTIGDAAARVGAHRTTFHRWMNGSDMPRPEAVRKIEQVTGGKVLSADLLAGYRA